MTFERRAIVTIGCSAMATALAACGSGGGGGGGGSTGPIVRHSVQGLYVASYHVTYPGVTELSLPLTDSSVGPSGAWSVPNPAQLAFDANGLLYASSPPITGTSPRQIVIQSLPLPGAGATVATLDMPAGMQPVFFALDPAGDLWVADANGANIYEFIPPFSGAMTPAVAATISDGFTPGGAVGAIAFDPAGNLYAVDSVSGRVLVFPRPVTDGESPTTQPLTGVLGARGMVFDRTGNLYVGLSSGAIVRYNAPTSGGGGPSLVDPASKTGIAHANFLAVDSVGDLYVTDPLAGNKVYTFSNASSSFSATSVPAQTALYWMISAGGIAAGPH